MRAGTSGTTSLAIPMASVPVALALAGLGAVLAYRAAGWRMSALFAVGLLLGVSLYHASFGFTSSWRRFLVTGDGRGVRAQMVMLALAVLLFFPALAEGQVLGMPVTGFIFPAGTSVAVGAFIFGIGMQLGGGCASGTLFTVGGGSTRMAITLAFFRLGRSPRLTCRSGSLFRRYRPFLPSRL